MKVEDLKVGMVAVANRPRNDELNGEPFIVFEAGDILDWNPIGPDIAFRKNIFHVHNSARYFMHFGIKSGTGFEKEEIMDPLQSDLIDGLNAVHEAREEKFIPLSRPMPVVFDELFVAAIAAWKKVEAGDDEGLFGVKRSMRDITNCCNVYARKLTVHKG